MSHKEIYNNFKEALFNASEEVKKDVLELKFGCVVSNGYENLKIVLEIETGDFLLDNGSIIKYDTNCKILGRPITLEDVLRVLDKKGKSIFPFTNGSFWTITNLMEPAFSLGYKWLLGLPADKQTDETLIKLTKLLQ